MSADGPAPRSLSPVRLAAQLRRLKLLKICLRLFRGGMTPPLREWIVYIIGGGVMLIAAGFWFLLSIYLFRGC